LASIHQGSGGGNSQVTDNWYACVDGTDYLPDLAIARISTRSAAETTDVPAAADRSTSADDIYEIYFHGPAYQVLDEAWSAGGDVVGRMVADLLPNQDPADAPLATAPRLTELCFQTAGVWEIGTTGSMALPMRVGRVVPTVGGEPAGEPALAVVKPADDGGFEANVVDGAGRVLLRLEGYRTVQLPGALDDGQVAPLRTAMSGEG